MTSRLVFLFSIFIFGCSNNSGFLGQDDDSKSSGQSLPAGAVNLFFVSPSSDFVANKTFNVSISAEPLSEIKALTLYVNDQVLVQFNTQPFTTSIDPSQFQGDSLTLKVISIDRLDRPNQQVLVLYKEAQNSSADGKIDSNCMNNNQYDACIFWKNPVAQKGSPYSAPVQFGQNLAEQTFGVQINGLNDSQRLANSSFNIVASNGKTAGPGNERWKFSYKNDASNHYVAQVMAYYWLNYQQKQMTQRTGVFYASNKNIKVDAYNTSVKDNAYWDGQQVVMGVVTNNSKNSHEMALSAEVYLHEMGHANLQYAVGRILYDNNTTFDPNFCKSSAGCVSAINEGQADFHFLMIFNTSTALGETFANSLGGIQSFGVSRDVKAVKNLKATDFYNKSSGEIHTMGTAYASILWSIYTDPQVNRQEFEKIFSLHLQKLSESTRFPEAKALLLAEDQAFFGGKYQQIITAAFAARGL